MLYYRDKIVAKGSAGVGLVEKPLNPPKNSPKLPYRAPRLVCFGDVAKITRAKGGLLKDGSSGNSKL
jgi:hypothetical protein